MARDVFISHSAQDKKVAETICAALEEKAIRCWVAPRDVRPGKAFPGEITRAIQQCKVMLLIFSRHSNSSEQVLREVQLAVDSHLPIVRFRIEDVPLSDDLRYYLSTPHWLDALTASVSKHIPALVAAIRELIGAPADRPNELAESTPPPAARVPPEKVEGPAPRRNTALIAWAIIVVAVLAFAAWGRRPKRNAPVPVSPPAEVSPTVVPSAVPAASPSPSPPLPTPSPSATETPEVRASPSAPPVSKKGVFTRNDRSWQAWIDEFVHNFIASNETNDLDLALSFYAPNVELFEEGRKSDAAIRRDIEAYNARWPSRRATIRGDVRLTEKTPSRNYAASFEHDYYVENSGRGEWINGAVAVDLQITIDEAGRPRIVSMKQKTLRRDKGTMQKR